MANGIQSLSVLFESIPTHPSDIESGARLRILGSTEGEPVRFLEIEEPAAPRGRRVFVQLTPKLVEALTQAAQRERPGKDLPTWLSIYHDNRGDPYEEGLTFVLLLRPDDHYGVSCFVPMDQIASLSNAVAHG